MVAIVVRRVLANVTVLYCWLIREIIIIIIIIIIINNNNNIIVFQSFKNQIRVNVMQDMIEYFILKMN